MKDLRVEIKIKNNLLYRRITEKYRSVAQFCIHTGLSPTEVGRYLNFKQNPISKHPPRGGAGPKIKSPSGKGYWKISALKIADKLECNVLDIFTEALAEPRENSFSTEMSSQDLIAYQDQKHSNQLLLDGPKPNQGLLKALATLTPREELIVRKVVGWETNAKSFVDIGDDLDISGTRVAQIYRKAIRKLRQPTRVGIIQGD